MYSIIEVDNVSRNYKLIKKEGKVFKELFFRNYELLEAVSNISFKIEPGEVVGFIGPNGAGKSTTIKIMTGILLPSRGKVEVLGNDPFKMRKKNAFKIGVVFGQRTQLWWDLPVKDSYQLTKKIYKIDNDIYKKNVELYFEYLKMDKIWNRPVRQLSLGERIKTEIGISMLHNPQILFLDEPTIGLDILAKKQIRQFILNMHKERNTTIILTSHDMKDIEEMCKRIILIDKGKIVIDCALEHLKKTYGDKVIIDIKFKENCDLLNCQIDGVTTQFDKNQGIYTFLINTNYLTTGNFINQISTKASIEEIFVKESNIEDIISDIYEKKHELM